jgi:hypothetical protein
MRNNVTLLFVENLLTKLLFIDLFSVFLKFFNNLALPLCLIRIATVKTGPDDGRMVNN